MGLACLFESPQGSTQLPKEAVDLPLNTGASQEAIETSSVSIDRLPLELRDKIYHELWKHTPRIHATPSATPMDGTILRTSVVYDQAATNIQMLHAVHGDDTSDTGLKTSGLPNWLLTSKAMLTEGLRQLRFRGCWFVYPGIDYFQRRFVYHPFRRDYKAPSYPGQVVLLPIAKARKVILAFDVIHFDASNRTRIKHARYDQTPCVHHLFSDLNSECLRELHIGLRVGISRTLTEPFAKLPGNTTIDVDMNLFNDLETSLLHAPLAVLKIVTRAGEYRTDSLHGPRWVVSNEGFHASNIIARSVLPRVVEFGRTVMGKPHSSNLKISTPDGPVIEWELHWYAPGVKIAEHFFWRTGSLRSHMAGIWLEYLRFGKAMEAK